ncbi:MAG TPA: ABC transporter permease [Opitutaceae bacterium]|nr:ABC transporter permease [Opitutaceae bacterium]
MRVLTLLRTIVSGFRSLLRRRSADRELAEELDGFLEMAAEAKVKEGLSRADAQRAVRLERGSLEAAREEVRATGWESLVESGWQDGRLAVRVLRKSPSFTAVAVGTLALAIGANAVVFGVWNALIRRPLNLPRAESLYGIEHGNEHNMWESYPDYCDLRDRNRSFDGLAGFSITQVGLDTGDQPSAVWVDEVTGNYFDVLGIQPHRGRFFHAADEHGSNSASYLVLGYDCWQNRFHGDPEVVGRVVRVNKHPFTIIGVAPPGFHGVLLLASPDFFVPIVNQEQVEGRNTLETRATHSLFMVLGHLKAAATPEQAAEDLNAIGAYLLKTYPQDHGTTTFVLARPGLYGNLIRGPAQAFLTGLMLLAGLILLAACANLGSLFAARAADRSREIALRLALGAGRLRLLRQLLTEALVVSLAGGALGLWGGVALLRGLCVWQPFSRYPVRLPVNPDPRVYAIALGLALVSGLLLGIAPLRQVLRTDPYQIIKSGSIGPRRRRITGRDLLLVAQIAICALLVTASLVAVRGLARSLHGPFGFEPRRALVLETELNMADYRGDRATAMQRRILDAVAAIPGVQSAGVVGRPPLAGGGFASAIYADETADLRPANAAATAVRFHISPGYATAAGTALLAGREFTWHDDKDAPRVAVVNQEFARKLFGSVGNAVGGHFKLRDGTRIQVVGVVEDGKYLNLTEDPQPALFLPLPQKPMSETCLIVRSERDPQLLAAATRSALRDLDPGLPVVIQTWTDQLGLQLFPARMATASLGVLGAMGAMLSVTGIFGLAAYAVSRRLKELGIRVALGAQAAEVLQAALGRPLKLLAIGSVAGLVLGFLASRVLASIVYQASPRDPLVLAGVVLAMALLGLVATWIPARRALALDPLMLLREE